MLSTHLYFSPSYYYNLEIVVTEKQPVTPVKINS